MALVPKLELRQGQQLVMTPQLQQAIRLLQLSNVELCSFVEAEVERNPLLERDELGPEPEPPAKRGEDRAEDSEEWVARHVPTAEPNGAQEDREVNGTAPANGADPDPAGWGSLRPRTHNS